MSVEIHQPEIEALIQERMASGAFQDVEEVLIHALRSAPMPQSAPAQGKQNFTQFLKESPLWGSGLTVERSKDSARKVDL